jgi:hypothetical protein
MFADALLLFRVGVIKKDMYEKSATFKIALKRDECRLLQTASARISDTLYVLF